MESQQTQSLASNINRLQKARNLKPMTYLVAATGEYVSHKHQLAIPTIQRYVQRLDPNFVRIAPGGRPYLHSNL